MMWKRALALPLALCLCLCLATGVSADAAIDLNAHGSITVTTRLNDQPVVGGTLTVYRAARLVWDGTAYTFAFTDEFANAALPLENLNTEEAAAAYVGFISDHELQGVTQTVGETGTVVFSDLPLGLYVVVQPTAAPGYTAVSPFLVTVPTTEKTTVTYDVEASPKVTVEHDPSYNEPPDDPGDSEPPSGDVEDPSDDPSVPPTDPSTPTTPTTTPNTTQKIPQTGQLKWPVPLLAASGILAFSLGWFLCFVKRQPHDET